MSSEVGRVRAQPRQRRPVDRRNPLTVRPSATRRSPRPFPTRATYLRRRLVAALCAVAVIVLLFVSVNAALGGGARAPGSGAPVTGPSPTVGEPVQTGYGWLAPPSGPGHLLPGSNPAVLPGPVLIADKLNNRLVIVDPEGRVRWVWPRPGDLAPGQTFKIPDDAFFSPDGRYIVVTQEDDFLITVIDVATRRIVWRYGHPSVAGSGAGYLWNPDDAMLLRNGVVASADIKNCRLITIPYGGRSLAWHEGTVGSCTHNPPVQYGSPNGMFPLPNGHFLVTEINGDWVDEIDLSGHVYWSTNPPGVLYPSDSSQLGPGRYLTVDYSSPGLVVIFDRAGHTLWRYAQSRPPSELNHPSLAIGLPNGDILLNDDQNHRVVVIDPRTDKIVWQYGHDGVPGTAPGYLDNPDGLDLLPPNSYADRYQPRGE